MSSSVARGDFNALNLPTWDREMIESAYKAVESVPGGWEFLSTYDPGDGGFMFSKPPPKMEEINDAVNREYGGHSGASYGMTMRVIQYIAKYGWDNYARDMLKKYGPPTVGPPQPTTAAAPAAPASMGAAGNAGLAMGLALEQAATMDNFLSTLPADTTLTSFADAIQQDAGMRRQIPDIDEQSDALRRFAEGKMTYAEMRMLCG